MGPYRKFWVRFRALLRIGVRLALGSLAYGIVVLPPDVHAQNTFAIQAGAPSGSLFINSTGNVGIGTTSPTQPLHILTNTDLTGLLIQGTGIAIRPRLFLQRSDAVTTGTFGQVVWNNSAGANMGLISTEADGATNSGFMSFQTTSAGVAAERMRITSAGNVGIGTTNPQRILHIASGSSNYIRLDTTGTAVDQGFEFVESGVTKGYIIRQNGFSWLAFFAGGGAGADRKMVVTDGGNVGIAGLVGATANTLCYNTTAISGLNTFSTCSSSLRYKEDIRDLAVDKTKVFQLRPVNYKWKGRDERGVGLIAEEVAEVIPELVTYYRGRIEGVRYGELSVYLLNILKEHEQTIRQLKADNDAFKARIEALEGKGK